MRINIILPEFGLSGGVMVALRYAQALTEFGHDVMCYAKKLPYTKPNSFKDIAHSVHRVVSDYDVRIAVERCGKFDYRIPFLINNRSVRDADVIIATAWCTAFDVYKLDESKGKKCYFIQDHEIWDNKEKGIQSYKLPLKHIVIAKWIDDILVNQYGCPEGTIVYNGIDLLEFHPAEVQIDTNKPKTLLMMHHVLPKKGIGDGLVALSEVHEKYPDIKIRMFGKANFIDRPDYIEYYKDPEKHILIDLYQQADYYVFPSREEGWGLTVIEAMACGCVVIGTNAGCLKEIGVNGVNAMISEPGKPDILLQNLLRVIEDDNLSERIRRNSLETVKQLSWEESYRKFESALCR